MLRNYRWLVMTVILGSVATLAWSQTPSTLNDSEEPGSVLVFPLFETGTTSAPSDDPYGITATLPISEFEISVACPQGTVCPNGQPVAIHVEWVCGGSLIIPTIPCAASDFILYTTVHGTVRFSPSSTSCEPSSSCGGPVVPPPYQCYQGFAIAWAVDPISLKPIKFNGLIGDSELREEGTAVATYNAIPIQAVAAWPTGLHFDGVQYQAISGKIYGSLRYTYYNGSEDQDNTSLVLLTLDTLANRLNYPTYVSLNFFDEYEDVASEATAFVCWGETPNTDEAFGLNTEDFGPKGLVVSNGAIKRPVLGINDKAGPVTLLGLIVTREHDTDTSLLREFVLPLHHNNVPLKTTFVP
jgi:hypothetical protein